MGALGHPLLAQYFSDQTSTYFPTLSPPAGVAGGDLVWADFNRDGTLDVVLNGNPDTGTPQTEVRLRNGSTFSQAVSLSPTFSVPVDAVVGDLNQDGFPDLVVSSRSSTPFTRVYLYDNATNSLQGTNSFSTALTNFSRSAIDLADFNNDGYLDLAVVGRNSSTNTNRIQLYRNVSGGSFILDFTNSAGVEQAWIDWGDYDQDGDQDLLFTGVQIPGGSTGVARILRKNAAGNFDISNPNLIGLHDGGGTWSDFDNDGDLDIMLWGRENGTNTNRTLIYRNDSLAGFALLPFEPDGIRQGQVALADYDNDGWRDLIVLGNNGNSSNNRQVEAYLNDQAGSFFRSNTATNDLEDQNDHARLAFGDVNNDGRVDLLSAGDEGLLAGITTLLFENDLSNPALNLPPPSANPAIGAGNSIILSWSPPAGLSPVLARGLSYEVYVRTTPGQNLIRSPLSNLSNGTRLAAQDGSVQGLTLVLSDLPAGNYQWGVQAVGPNFEGSLFTAPQSFTISSSGSSGTSFNEVTTSTFSPAPGGLARGDLVWGDLDNDGDLDLIVSGENAPGSSVSFIFRNLEAQGGNGFAEETSFTLPALVTCDIDLVDIDNDNDLDIAISGANAAGTRITRIYENQQSVPGTIAINPVHIALPGGAAVQVSFADMAWGDFDRDGDQDLVLTGQTNSGGAPGTFLFENRIFPDGTRSFVNRTADVSPSLPNIRNGAVEVADFNQDGWPDLVLAGNSSTSTQPILRVYLKAPNTNWVFNSVTGFGNGLQQCDLAVADLNNDGNLDFLLSGNRVNSGTPSNAVDIFLYDNGTFTPQSLSLPRLYLGSVDLGDYDDDGWIDLIISGSHTVSGSFEPIEDTTFLYRNVSSPNQLAFQLDLFSSNTLENVGGGSRAYWGDYDLDGKLDLAVIGDDDNGQPFFGLYRNTNATPNQTLAAPNNLQSQIDGFDVNLSWSPPANAGAITGEGISYNLWLRQVGNDTLLRSPLAETGSQPNNGFRRVAELGNLFQATSYTFRPQAAGDYQWRIQAVDQDHEGSAFSPVASFSFEDPSFDEVTNAQFLSLPQPPQEAAIAIADYSGDNFLDFALLGRRNDTEYRFDFYRYDPTNDRFFIDASNASLPTLTRGAAAFGDINQDNLPDLAFLGEDESGVLFAQVRTNAGGAFTSAASTVINLLTGGLRNGALAFADYNRDGYADLVITGENASGQPITRFFRNNRLSGVNVNFIDDGNLGLPDLRLSRLDWGDINQDGWPDLAIMGTNSSGTPRSAVYLNDQRGGFTLLNVQGLPNLTEGDLAWGDFDADGWLDLAISGLSSGNNRVARVYHNSQDFSGNTALTNWGAPLIATSRGSVAWGDYDNDDFLDLIITGQDGPNADTDRSVHLYRYDDGLGQFVDELIQATPLPPVNQGSLAAWLDFNQDGKLDLLMAGRSGSGTYTNVLALFENINAQPVNSPAVPTGLSHEIDGYDVELSWADPGRDGLSYNLLLDNSNTFSVPLLDAPLADLGTGARREVAFGQVHDSTALRLHNLPAGQYFWKVQAIAPNYQGSPFSVQTGSFAYKAPAFLDSTESFLGGFDGLENGDLAWVDYDLDGDLDLCVAGTQNGSPLVDILANDGGTLTPANLGLPALADARLSWADVDGDLDLDAALMGGTPGNATTRLLRNNGNGTFTVLPAGLPDARNGDLAFFDADNDGDPDLVISGERNGNPFTELYQNDGNGNFSARNQGFEPLQDGAIAALDVNADDLQDLLVLGRDANGIQQAALYRNLGYGSFRRIPSGNLGQLFGYEHASVDVADYDQDGLPDLVVCGLTGVNRQTRVLRNRDGSGAFDLAFAAPGVERGSVRWGDFDDDDRPEFAVVGFDGATRLANLYRFDGSSFVAEPILADPVIPTTDGSLAWGDVNQDGKLDLALSGRNHANLPLLRLLRNVDSSANLVPQAPTGLSQRVDADTVIFSWNAPSGGAAYTYHVYARRVGDTDYLVAPLAALSSGQRRVAQRGNAGGGLTFKLVAPPSGTIEWGVQAVAPDFEGSVFATGNAIAYERPDFIPYNVPSLDAAVPAFERGQLAWGDVDSDGRLDLLVTGRLTNGDASTQLLRYDNTTDQWQPEAQPLENLQNSAAAWADYDRDGDLDLALMGESSGGQAITALYLNNGSGDLTRDNRSSGLLNNLGLSGGDLHWVDFDQDGDLDLLLAGADNSQRATALLENDGNGAFRRYALFSAPGLGQAAIAVGDYDRDGSQDLALLGFDGSQPVTLIYRNLGFRGGFQLLDTVQAPLPGLRDGSLAWADANHDGWLDLALSGLDATNQPVTALYLYDETSGRFEARPESELLPMARGTLAWGDYNDDGLADLIHWGQDATGTARVRLYANENGNALRWDSVASVAMQPMTRAFAAWGDFDQDGKLDLAALGTQPGDVPLLEWYRNQNQAANQVPAAPGNLSAAVQADSVVLTWTAPNAAGQTFNLLVGTDSSDLSVIAPMADPASGQRQIAATGHASQLPRYRLMGLRDTTYFWQVQRIGADFEGSPFSGEIGSFDFVQPHFTDVSAITLDTAAATGYDQADVAWADFDDDGFLDFAVAGLLDGTPVLALNRSADGRAFTQVRTLPGLAGPNLAWTDYDLDGQLDLLVTGEENGAPATRLYARAETLVPSDDLPNLRAAAMAWGDFDHDGDPDLLLSGTDDNDAPQTGLWLNTGDSLRPFQAAPFALDALDQAAVAWLDANRDSYLDALVVGQDEDGLPQLQLYRNDTKGLLVPQTVDLTDIELLSDPQLAVADFDQDGYPDLALTGQSGSIGPRVMVLRHNGDAVSPGWSEVPGSIDLPLLAGGDLAWGDYNDDGRSDLAVVGETNDGTARTTVLMQQSDTTFRPDTLANNYLPDLGAGTAMAWGDYNGDRKLDLIVAGTGTAPTLGLYRNDEPTPDQPLGAPTDLRRRVIGSGLRLSWQPPAGYDSALVDGLTYQLFLIDDSTGQLIIPALADTTTGLRAVPQSGEVRHRLNWRVENLRQGRSYRWGVQAIGPDLVGSPFAKASFRFDPPAFEWANDDVFPDAPAGLTDATTAAADYDGDGDLDLAVTGITADGEGLTRLYRNILGEVPNRPNQARFVLDDRQPNLLAVQGAALAWGDFNGDNLPDLFLSGQRSDASYDAALYLNEGGILALDNVVSQAFIPVRNAAAAWADYDRDGDQDLLVAGQTEEANLLTQLYRNEGGQRFVRDTSASADLADVEDPVLLWADFEGDNLPDGLSEAASYQPDLFLSGNDAGGIAVTRVYRNLGGRFAVVPINGLVPVQQAGAAWCFINQDSFPDLVVTGEANDEALTHIYQYNAANHDFDRLESLAEQSDSLLDMTDGTVLLGDMDGDGLQDILLAGSIRPDTSLIQRTVLYRQVSTADDQAVREDLTTSADLDSAKASTFIWLDFNRDGRPDLFSPDALTLDTREPSFAFFENIVEATPPTPQVPRNPDHFIVGNEVSLRWESPAPELPLTFNLYLRRQGSDDTLTVSTLADLTDGTRRVVGYGNRTRTTEVSYLDLPDGTYYWGVQTIGPDYQASPFTEVDSFVYRNPVPEVVELFFPDQFPDDQTSVQSYLVARLDTNIEAVVVHHKFIEADNWQQDTLATGVAEQAGDDGDETERFEYNIPLAAIDEMGIEYYYEIIGAFGDNRTITDTGYTYRYYADGLAYNNLQNGTQVEAYQIISVPLTLDDARIESVIPPAFGGYNRRQYRIFQWQGGEYIEFGEGAEALRPGEGTWLISRRTRSFNSGPGLVVRANDRQPYAITLQPGWNLIGNPFPYAISWSEVEAANPAVAEQLDPIHLYNSGYATVTTVPELRGGFIWSNATSPLTLELPVRKNPQINRLAAEQNRLRGRVGTPRWQVPIYLQSGPAQSRIAAVGMHPEASPAHDAWDVMMPPRMADFLELFTRHPEHPNGAFAQDVVATAEQYVWEFELASNLGRREIELRWPTFAAEGGKQLVLFDVEHQYAVPMHERDHYLSFSDEETRHFRIYYGDAAFIASALQPERIHLGQAFPNPVEAGRGVLIPVGLPPGQTYSVRLSLVNLQGQEVHRLPVQSLPGGFHHLKWDGLDKRGQPLPGGLYLYQIQVSSPSGSWQQARKLHIH